MTEKDYKYDVAFSFVSEDEVLAGKLNDLVEGRLSTFFYSRNQESIAGTDGEKTFNRVFGEECRIVVVFFRGSWGQTPWTRIEQTAIRNRAYNEGYEFVLVIPVEDKPSVPPWLPRTALWIGLNRWGLEGAAAAIEARVQQAGGSPHEESLTEKAQRLHLEAQFAVERKGYLGSTNGVRAANEEAYRLFDLIEAAVSDITNNSDFKIKSVRSGDGKGIDVNVPRLSLAIDWNVHFNNSLDDSELSIVFWNGIPPRPERRNYFDRPDRKSTRKFEFDRVPDGTLLWRSKSSTQTLTSERLVNEFLKILMEDSRSMVRV